MGPGLVLIALGLGSGEFILWPSLVTAFGFGVLGGAVIGITCQYFVNTESLRYTLATGASVYVGFAKLSRFIPAWFILSTFLSFMWPGIIGSAGTILADLFNVTDSRVITIALLGLIGFLLTYGGKVYNTLEKIQKLFLLITIPALVIIAVVLADTESIGRLAAGFLGFGEGYYLIPAGISLSAFLGAIAYSGAAGNLVISSSFYIQDKGYGAAGNLNTQIDPNNQEKVLVGGNEFEPTPENRIAFKRWFRFASNEQFVSFWLLGLITIGLLAYIGYQLLYPVAGASESLDFVFLQSQNLALRFNQILGTGFLAVGAMFLFTTQLGIYETTSRIITENLQLLSAKLTSSVSRSRLFFICLWLQITAAALITLLDVRQPLQILIIGTFFSAISMFVLAPLLLWLNNSRFVYKEIRPGVIRQLALILTGAFFAVFVILTLAGNN